MYRKNYLTNIQKTHLGSPSTRHLGVGGGHGVDRFGPDSSSGRPGNRRRISALELELRLRFNRLLREKKSNLSEEQKPSWKIKTQDDWIGWMLIWKKNPAVLDRKQLGETVYPTTTDSAALAVANRAFGRRRTDMVRRKDLSPPDAALIIQKNFRDHMKRKSNAIQELALANAKLKEVRNWFYKKNSSYRKGGKFSLDAEDHQEFQKKTIVLLMTVDAVEGATAKICLAKKIMTQELETMLDKADRFIYTRLKINAVPNASEMAGHGAMLLRLAFGRRLPEENKKWIKEMSVNEAATVIERRFREYMVRKANAVKAHKELASVEAKMELVRGLCKKNFDDDQEELIEKIVVLLLTLLDIKDANFEDRLWQTAMTNELEAMLNIVDPQPNLPNAFQNLEGHL